MIIYPDVHTAFLGELGNIVDNGQEVESRLGDCVKEVIHRTFTIEHPDRAIIITPHRNNNIFITMAETLWVMAGRNDLLFLSRYMPRAIDYSDDGKVWRGAYGNRLRNWHGVDQFQEVINLLQKDMYSRRAVMQIFDPALDFVDSKDIPCNDHLQFIIRDAKLHMLIATRSNDVMWGWSGINTFEWSFLQRLLASILKVGVGQATYCIGSFHLYDKHYKRAHKILENAVPSIYEDNSSLVAFEYSDLWRFDYDMAEAMESEYYDLYHRHANPISMLTNLMVAYRTERSYLLDKIQDCDWKMAAEEYLSRGK